MAGDGLRLFTHAPFGRFFIGPAVAHFTEKSLTLHFLLQNAKGLIHIVVAYEYLHM